jgi:uncharacterized protein YkwD
MIGHLREPLSTSSDMRSRRKTSTASLFLHFSKFFIFFAAFVGMVLLADKSGVSSKLVPGSASDAPKTITVQRTIVYVTPTPEPFIWSVEKVNEHETAMSLPADPRMSTSDELFTALNQYRSSNGISPVNKNDTLCSIAQHRADEQLANGGLDDHAGFDKYVQGQNEFSRMGEVLFGGNQPQYGVHIVEFGWARSLTGHREAIRDTSWSDGCGGIAGYYAVFIFGSR